MKVVKTVAEGFLAAPYGQGGNYFYAVAGLIPFRLSDPAALMNEQELWRKGAPELGENLLDAGPPKPAGEFLVAGSAFATPPGKKLFAMTVKASVGDRSRVLSVFGPRRWQTKMGVLAPGNPDFLTVVPLDWVHAYGGSGYEANRVGKGFGRSGEVTPESEMASVEDPKALVKTPDDRPEPASFLPMPVTHPARLPYRGTYDQKWIDLHWPTYPVDLSPRYFMVAHPDQRMNGYFTGDEPVRLSGMNAERPEIDSRLPGKRMRIFVNQIPAEQRGLPPKEQKPVFKELTAKLDTVWLFPGVDMGVVLWRGVTGVADHEATDIVNVYLAHESLSGADRLSFDEHRARFEKGLKTPLDADMKPFEEAEAKLKEAEAKVAALRNRGDATVKGVVNMGAAATVAIGAAAGTISMAQAAVELGITEKELAEATKAHEEAMKKVEGLLDRVQGEGKGKSAYQAAIERTFATGPEQEKMIEQAEEAYRLAMERSDRLFGKMGIDPKQKMKIPDIPHTVAAPKLSEAAKQAMPADKVAIIEGILASIPVSLAALKEMQVKAPGHEGGTAPPKEPTLSTNGAKGGMTRQRFLDMVANKESFDKVTVERLDLTGADLTGANLAGITMRDCDLSGANLTGADLSGGTALNPTMTGATLAGAKLVKTIFNKGTLKGANGVGLNGEGAAFIETDLSGVIFDDASLNSIFMNKVDLTDATFTNATMAKGAIISSTAVGARFDGARLKKTSFMQTDLTNSRHVGAYHEMTVFVESRVDGADFSGATMEGAKGLRGSSFNGATFNGMNQKSGVYMGCAMRKADFTGATMSRMMISESDLTDATLDGVSAKGSRIEKTILTGASMRRLDLMNGSMQLSRLDKTDLADASLYRVDLLGTQIYDTTNVHGANLTGVRLPARTKDENR